MKTHGLRLTALAVGMIALVAAGCGGGAPTSHAATSTADAQAQALTAFSACMRSHGVPNFPDLRSLHRAIRIHNGKATVDGVALDVSSSVFQAAQQACAGQLKASRSATASAQAQQKALALAQCMRAHGVPNFPDPKVSNAGITFPYKGDRNSAQFKAARKACGNITVPGLGG